jgi:NAD-dependent SIR2 family protein deacetylase
MLSPRMKCPYCYHTFPLTWGRYLKSLTGKHVCPSCLKPSRLKFRALTFIILLVVCYVTSRPGVFLVGRWLGRQWSALGVITSLIVVLPLGKKFESWKELTPIAGEAWPEISVCVECKQTFKTEDMIAHQGVHVCAGCKPILLQKLAEGASL